MSDVYYDQYSVEINADPYPVYRRLRDEAPLYYNEQYNFYAVSRFEDAERVIRKKLKEVLASPEVQVTFAGWTSDEKRPQ